MTKTIKISEDLHTKIKIYCAKNKLKINDWVEKELMKYAFDVDTPETWQKIEDSLKK